jgi:LysR family glycine cleavage system transcriptional activator
LGVVLFRRTSKGLELTDEAAAGLDAIREGFLRFEEGVQAMQAGQSSHVYTIACPRDFFAAWFSQRLADFRAQNPALRFSLVGAMVISISPRPISTSRCAGPRGRASWRAFRSGPRKW